MTIKYIIIISFFDDIEEYLLNHFLQRYLRTLISIVNLFQIFVN